MPLCSGFSRNLVCVLRRGTARRRPGERLFVADGDTAADAAASRGPRTDGRGRAAVCPLLSPEKTAASSFFLSPEKTRPSSSQGRPAAVDVKTSGRRPTDRLESVRRVRTNGPRRNAPQGVETGRGRVSLVGSDNPGSSSPLSGRRRTALTKRRMRMSKGSSESGREDGPHRRRGTRSRRPSH